MTYLQILVRQAGKTLHEEVVILGKQALEWRAKCEALQLALETERGAADLYAKQVAHWIGKHDALLEQQLTAQPVKQCLNCLHYNEPLASANCASCIHGGNVGDNFVELGNE